MSKFLLILILGSLITFGVISFNQNKNISQATENSVDNYAQTKARNVANSTILMLMSTVADDYDFRVVSPTTIQVLDGDVTYFVIDETFEGEDQIKFSVTANVYGVTKSVVAYTDKFPFFPPSFRGAITANSSVLSNGNMTIDGRNHTALGTVIPETGSYAIWTTGTFTQMGTSDLGGTDLKIDYVPSNPANPNVIKENQIWSGGFPDSPDMVLGGPATGFPEGTLKSIAQSGINGSQYVTNPSGLSGNPLSGVTYLELPTNFPHNQWKDMDITGSGVLVLHNSAKNAIMKNLLSGTFKGIIIVDDLIHVQDLATVIGTIIILTPAPTDGNCVGNSDGKVLYSTEAVFDALTGMNLEKRMFNYGFSNSRLYVTNWLE
ncbi:MAG: hypothetical protein OEM46_03055 [Ignavibacteria bacterium]|nr:hypothetical protein [Ignavibacteria bacterium]